MKEPIAEIVELPKSARQLAQEAPGAAAVFESWLLVWFLIWSAIMFQPGQIAKAWNAVKAKWEAERERNVEELAVARAAALPVTPELSDADRVAIQEILTLAE